VRLGFITLGKHVPSTRFRFLPYFPYLENQGHTCRLWMSYPSVYEHIPWLGWRLSHALKRSVRYSQIAAAKFLKPDCIYLERGCLNDDSLDLDMRFRRQTPRLVLDVDDGIFLEHPKKIDRLIAMSDHCIVSSSLIADYVRQRHAQVTVIPTAVSMARYVARPAVDSRIDRRTVIGWIGTLPNMPFLAVCASALRRLAEKYDFELFVVAPASEPLSAIDLAGVNVNFQTWQPDLEISHLHRMDIGLMPLPAGKEWMQYKAATKLVQYLSIGIPAVASPIGVNELILKDNRVGFSASNSNEWYEALELLLRDIELRNRLGVAGRELVAQTYSVEANAPILERVLCDSRSLG
jgi:glycosyltransferase involved in cell wall biosynthesis